MRVLIMASPVAPLGAGKTGGVTMHVANTAAALAASGHEIQVMAPVGSRLPGFPLIEIGGTLQPSGASEVGDGHYPVPPDGVLACMWRAAFAEAGTRDVIVNMAHDWLPYYLTDMAPVPVFHIVNMADVNVAITAEIVRVSEAFPGRVGVMTDAQAARLGGLPEAARIGFGLDLSVYEPTETPRGGLVWAGRISPEKGLEDALAVARALGERLAIAGAVDNDDYWQGLKTEFAATIDHRGFLATCDLQALMGQARALLQTQKWHEAFGIVTVEALACGTPVIAYDRGANSELIADGVSGRLVPADDVAAAVAAVRAVARIDRRACRAEAERRFSLAAYGKRLDAWLAGGR